MLLRQSQAGHASCSVYTIEAVTRERQTLSWRLRIAADVAVHAGFVHLHFIQWLTYKYAIFKIRYFVSTKNLHVKSG